MRIGDFATLYRHRAVDVSARVVLIDDFADRVCLFPTSWAWDRIFEQMSGLLMPTSIVPIQAVLIVFGGEAVCNHAAALEKGIALTRTRETLLVV
jgi:hypothetical protein